MSRGSEAISPTALYTGHVWFRNGLSHPDLATRRGRLLFEAVRPAMVLTRAAGGATLEDYLLARHKVIDAKLARAIEEDGVTQVIEVACGLSPRGWRFSRRFGDRITYLEGDLPQMAAEKRRALARMGSLGARHRVVELDALADDGPRSMAAVAGGLDRDAPLAIVTEGLLGYYDRDAVMGMWQRFARTLGEFSGGVYLSDTYLHQDMPGQFAEVFRAALGAFVRGRVHIHFADVHEAEAALAAAGLVAVTLRRADEDPAARGLGNGGRLVRIVEARAPVTARKATSRSRPLETP